MKLFPAEADPTQNLLPQDGIVNYYGTVLTAEQADSFYTSLLTEIEWQNDKAVIYGKEIVTKRKVAWYGDEAFEYTYSNTSKYALPWTACLLELKQIAEKYSQTSYNSCLLNLYHNGGEGMAWHSDAEKDLVKHGTIASLSFGAERRFLFKHKNSGTKVETILEHGSMLLMRGTTQDHWLHSLPKAARIHEPRINLTFRTIREGG